MSFTFVSKSILLVNIRQNRADWRKLMQEGGGEREDSSERAVESWLREEGTECQL